jgi:lysozyme
MKRIFQISFFILLLLASSLSGQTKTSSYGIAVIEHFEGSQLRAYLCPAHIWTIGHGHTGSDVYAGMVITKKQELILLKNDLIRFENYVNRIIERNIKFYEFDAVISFTFNVGYRIDRELKQALDVGNSKIVTMKLLKYNKAKVNGVYMILPGLNKRRLAECSLYQNRFTDPILRGIF